MTTFVFPGQGSQFVGMSKDFYENFKVSQEVFDLPCPPPIAQKLLKL